MPVEQRATFAAPIISLRRVEEPFFVALLRAILLEEGYFDVDLDEEHRRIKALKDDITISGFWEKTERGVSVELLFIFTAGREHQVRDWLSILRLALVWSTDQTMQRGCKHCELECAIDSCDPPFSAPFVSKLRLRGWRWIAVSANGWRIVSCLTRGDYSEREGPMRMFAVGQRRNGGCSIRLGVWTFQERRSADDCLSYARELIQLLRQSIDHNN